MPEQLSHLEPTEPINPRFTPLEVVAGREALAQIHTSIAAFQEFTSELPLGHDTRIAYEELLQTTATRPDRVQIFAEGQPTGQLVHEDRFHTGPNHRDLDLAPDKFLVEIVPSDIGVLTDEVFELAGTLGIEIDQNTATRLAYDHLIRHELAHGIQEMYSYVLPSDNSGWFRVYQRLQKNAIDQGIVEAVEVPADPSRVPIIEQERFAEGIGQMFVVHEMVDLQLIAADDTDKITKIHQMLSEQRRKEKFHLTQQAVGQFSAGEQTAFYQYLRERGLDVSYIGYGMAHGPKTLNRILALTP